MLQIRETTAEDISLIQQLAAVVWPHTFAQLLSPEQIAYMMDMMYSTTALQQQMTEQNHHYLLAHEGGQYLGYVSYEHNYKGAELTKLHKIYVLPTAQGKGVGCLFIDYISELACGHGVGELSLNVNKYNDKAIGFYKRMGFSVVNKEEIDIGCGFIMDDYVMNKKL